MPEKVFRPIPNKPLYPVGATWEFRVLLTSDHKYRVLRYSLKSRNRKGEEVWLGEVFDEFNGEETYLLQEERSSKESARRLVYMWSSLRNLRMHRIK